MIQNYFSSRVLCFNEIWNINHNHIMIKGIIFHFIQKKNCITLIYLGPSLLSKVILSRMGSQNHIWSSVTVKGVESTNLYYFCINKLKCDVKSIWKYVSNNFLAANHFPIVYIPNIFLSTKKKFLTYLFF